MGCTVLVVDDGGSNREILKKILISRFKLNPDDIETAEDGLDCLEKLSKRVFDVIFMDLEMPNLNGIQASYLISGRLFKQIDFLTDSQNAHTSLQSHHNSQSSFVSHTPSHLTMYPYPILARKSSNKSLQNDFAYSDPTNHSYPTSDGLSRSTSTSSASYNKLIRSISNSSTAYSNLSRSSSMSTNTTEFSAPSPQPYHNEAWEDMLYTVAAKIVDANRGIKIIAVTASSSYANIPGFGDNKMDCECETTSSDSSSNESDNCSRCCTLERYCLQAGMFAVVKKPVTAKESLALLTELMNIIKAEKEEA